MERGSGTFIAGLFTGALVGASLAMVFAPVSGGDMREVLRAKASDAADRANDTLESSPT